MRLLLIGILSFFGASSLEARESRAQKQEVSLQFRHFFSKAERAADCAKGTAKERERLVAQLKLDFEPLVQRLSGPRREQTIKSFADFGEAVVKGQPEECLKTLVRTKTDWKEFFRLVASPSQTPELALGRQTYATHCASCHGSKGKGDGALASKGRPMVPPPTDFTAESARLISPYRSFNVMITGINGTTMGSYEELLSTHEMWSLAFYLATLSQPQAPAKVASDPVDIDLETLSYRSDAEIMTLLPPALPPADRRRMVYQLRLKSGFDATLPRRESTKR